ncbi:MAG: hypothetical protein K8L99_21420 [Anaerolineae bacterium]|nr:hypothetical protein [Anaerolineae bacterium]
MQQKRIRFWIIIVTGLSLWVGGGLLAEKQATASQVSIPLSALPPSTQTPGTMLGAVPSAITAPILVSPEDWTVSDTLKPTFTWIPVDGAVQYEIRIWLNLAFTVFDETHLTTETSFTAPNDLKTPYYYSWSVRAQDENSNWSLWSEVWYVGITSPPDAVPQIYRSYIEPTLVWRGVTWATAYHIQIDRHEDFSSLIVDDVTILPDAASFTPPTLSESGVYYWRMRARRDDGSWGEWSATSLFSIIPIPTATRRSGGAGE